MVFKRNYSAVHGGYKRRKIGQSYRPKYRGRMVRPMGRPGQGNDKLFVKCQKLLMVNIAQLGATEAYGKLSFEMLRTCWKFHRYASLYSYFRVHKMKVTFASSAHVLTAYTMVDPDHDGTPNQIDQLLINRTSRTHNLDDNKVTRPTSHLTLQV